jgi:hypothetical protein
MKKEARLLLRKSLDSLLLTIELFNRPSEIGRTDHVMMSLDHAFEMFLKAAILQRGGRIREDRARQTIGFGACVRVAVSNASVSFLDNEQAMTIQTINSYRDAAQHHLLMLSEQMLYVHTQAGISLYRTLLKEVFGQELRDYLPERVLPVSTIAPTDLHTLFENEIEEVRKLLKPGTRKAMEARMRLRPLAILEGALEGNYLQPSKGELEGLCVDLRKRVGWEKVFPGIASINLTAAGTGPSLDLRITKKDGQPVTIVPEGTPGAAVVAIRRVNELDFYNLGLNDLAKKVQLSAPKTLAVITALGLQQDPECFKLIKIGKTEAKRYSQKAVPLIQEHVRNHDIDDTWRHHGAKRS